MERKTQAVVECARQRVQNTVMERKEAGPSENEERPYGSTCSGARRMVSQTILIHRKFKLCLEVS